jgi:TM2 domain-containing membrane protein YozV
MPAENPSGVVYGVIVIGALLAAESGRHETYLDTVGSAVIAAALYWLAHAYATVLGRRLSGRERLTSSSLRRALVHDWALIRGAAIPLLVLLIAWATGAAQQTAVSAALWSAVASLVGFELFAGLRSRASAGELALEVGVGALMGLGILALRIVLH